MEKRNHKNYASLKANKRFLDFLLLYLSCSQDCQGWLNPLVGDGHFQSNMRKLKKQNTHCHIFLIFSEKRNQQIFKEKKKDMEEMFCTF
jgi:hypothetical protein